MSTQRKLIRHAVRDVLNAAPSLFGRVKASRMYPVAAKNCPVVLVYTERDPATKTNDFMQKRELQLKIVVIVQADVDADDALDDLCEAIEAQVEAQMNGGSGPVGQLANLAESAQYVDTVLSYQGDDGRADFVHAEMQYSIAYCHHPATQFDDLAEVSVTIDMASPRNDPPDPHTPDGQVDARADIVFPAVS
ncbi:hypothetical protein SAMN05518865_110172 [Duganella sp. CF458]|uniref:hypothetical protein n=1 Tax=Duganella sp. CF458 TaxID=1884368 RepID=UPI0008F08AA0|nr:hypothetical protein [Duganella sp. CF458]SFG29685.1 hypothetical protein SAMN05518865_110172 [Duganella sp. CF458]